MLPNGCKLLTLRDAANYITALPKVAAGCPSPSSGCNFSSSFSSLQSPMIRLISASIATCHCAKSQSTLNTSKQIGDPEKVFANANASEAWFAENDPEGVAFEYEVLE